MGWIFMKGSITIHTPSYAVAVWLHLSFYFAVRGLFVGEIRLLLKNLTLQDSVPDKAGFYQEIYLSSHLNYLVDVITKYLQSLV
jgi:hypothetical protein